MSQKQKTFRGRFLALLLVLTLLLAGCAADKPAAPGSSAGSGSAQQGSQNSSAPDNGTTDVPEDPEAPEDPGVPADVDDPVDPEDPAAPASSASEDPELDALLTLALDYCEMKTGYRPSECAAEKNADGTVTIHLFDIVIDHTATTAWYTVDPETLKGTDDIMMEEIDLSEAKKDA